MSTLVTATVKSNTSGPVAFQNTSGTEIGTLCRAWVNFNGTGTVAIRASFNVSSITDNSAGNYTVNFTTAMADANYSYAYGGNYLQWDTNNNATGSHRVMTINSSGTAVDSQNVTVAIFR